MTRFQTEYRAAESWRSRARREQAARRPPPTLPRQPRTEAEWAAWRKARGIGEPFGRL